MNKVDNLKSKNGKFYYELSKKYYDYKNPSIDLNAGLLAIPFLKRAISVEENGEYYYALASIFLNSNSEFESKTCIDYLILALKNGFDKGIIYKDLLKCLKFLQFKYDIKKAEDHYNNLPNSTKRKGRFSVLKDKDEDFYRNLYFDAKYSCFDDCSNAIEALNQITDKSSKYYLEARNLLIEIYYSLGEYKNARRVYGELYDNKKYNSATFALCMLLESKDHYINVDMNQIKEWLGEAKIEPEDTGFEKYLDVCCEFKIHNTVINKCINHLSYTPYDIRLLFKLGIAYLNTREYEKAQDIFKRASIIKDEYGLFSYWYEVAGKLLEDSISGIYPNCTYSYDYDVPISEYAQRRSDIMETEKYFNVDFLDDDSMEHKIIDWSLLKGYSDMASRSLERLVYKLGNKVNPYLEKVMLSDFYPGRIKKTVLYYYFLNNPGDKVCFNRQGIYEEFDTLKYFDIKDETLFKAAARVYSHVIKNHDSYKKEIIKVVLDQNNGLKDIKDDKLCAYKLLRLLVPQMSKNIALGILDLPKDYVKDGE